MFKQCNDAVCIASVESLEMARALVGADWSHHTCIGSVFWSIFDLCSHCHVFADE